MKKSSRILSLVLAVLMVFSTLPVFGSGVFTAEAATAPIKLNGSSKSANSGTYNLFNSGITDDDSIDTSEYTNPAPDTYTNGGKDLYGNYFNSSSDPLRTIRAGLEFTVNSALPYAKLSIKAFDVDEEYGETDIVYLIDKTSGTKTRVGTLSGRNWEWNNTSINIPSSYFTVGHTYYFEVYVEEWGWETWIRTVSLETESDIDASLDASISASGTVTAELSVTTKTAMKLNVEYKAECEYCQFGSAFTSLSTSANVMKTDTTTFNLEEEAYKGIYTIYAFICDENGNVLITAQCTCGYNYFAVNYNANGGTNNVPVDTNPYESGDSATVLFAPAPENENGKKFSGWSENPNATKPTYTANGTNTIIIGTSDVTLYAVYGAAGTSKPVCHITSTNFVADEQTVTLYFEDDTGIAGYYWGTSSSPLGNPYVETSETSVSFPFSSQGTYYLYAKDIDGNLSDEVSATFYRTTLNPNGGTVNPTKILTMSGNSVILPTPSHPLRLKFLGWGISLVDGMGNRYTPIQSTTLKAVWKPTLIPSQSISIDPEEITVKIGETAPVIATLTPADTTDFVAWDTDADGIAEISSEGMTGNTSTGVITAVEAGSAVITATTTSGLTAQCLVTVPDTIAPTVTFSATNNVESFQTGTITIFDNYAIDGFYWGKNPNYLKNTYQKTATQSTLETAFKTIAESGTYYITAKDVAGNVSETISATFYKTQLDPNDGVVTPTSIITLSGNSVNLPIPYLTTIPAFPFDEWVVLVDPVNQVYGTAVNTASYKPDRDITLIANYKTVIVQSESVALNKTELTIPVGGSFNLVAELYPTDSTDVITWSSNKTSIAKVSSVGLGTTGTVSALAKGTVTITALTSSGKKATCVVTVTDVVVPATSVTLDKTSVNLAPGGTETLIATVLPANTTDTLKWTTSNSSVATVSGGKITAVAEGTATITAQAGDKTATCTVKVQTQKIPATSVALDRGDFSLSVGASSTLKATVTPSNSTDSLKWTSDNTAVATVNGGVVEAKAKGTAKITVKTDSGKTASVTVTVNEKSEFVWNQDNYNFNNSASEGSFTYGSYKSQMSEDYLEVLKSNLTNTEYEAVFTGYAGYSSWLDEDWGGSCYGMSATTLLAKSGLLNYSEWTDGATTLNALEKPTDNMDVSSLINYYQMLQVKDSIQQQYRTVPYRSNKENIQEILSLLDSNTLVLLGFQKAGWGGHAILAYGYGNKSYTSASGDKYDKCIYIVDPNFTDAQNEKAYIYYNSTTYDWCIPAYASYLITSKNGAVFNCVLADIFVINEGGYLTGSSGSSTQSNFVARIDAENISNKRSVSKVAPTSNGSYFIMNCAADDIVEDYSFVVGASGDKGTPGYNLKDSNASYKVTQFTPEELTLKIEYENSVLSADANKGTEVIFDKAGTVTVAGEDTDYDIKMSFDCDYPTEWYSIAVKGVAVDKVVLEKSELGYVLTGDNLSNVTVKANNRTKTATMTFSTTCKSVLIYEINATTIGILGDKDGDGVFETTVKGGNKPAKVLNLKATAATKSVALTWDAAAGATLYQIYRNGTLLNTVSATSYTDSTVVTGTSYTYKVRAINKGTSTIYGAFSAEVSSKATVALKSISACTVTLSCTSYTYNTAVKKPTVTVKNTAGTTITNGTSYTVKYCCSAGCKTVGTHTVTITGKGNYTGTVTKTFKIAKQSLVASRITLSATNYVYTGAVKKPTVTVKSSQGTALTNGSSYTVKYCCSAGCKTVGTHTVTITGKGNYTGTVTKTFTIKKNLAACTATLSCTSYTYNTAVKKPTVTVKNTAGTVITNGTSYTVKYCCSAGCKTVGTHTVTITGAGNYTGTIKKTFTIGKQSLVAARVTLSATNYVYTGAVKKPTVTVKSAQGTALTNGSSYTVKYCCSAGCKTVGTHTVTITGKGNYTGTVTKTFTIKKNLAACTATLSCTSYTYNTAVKKPTVTVKNTAGTVITNGTSYTVKYCCADGCKTAGTHTVTITGKGNYTGTIKKTFTIGKQSLVASRVTLSATSYTYTGAVKKPTVTVKTSQGTTLNLGTSYKVAYCCSGGCKTKGTHKVTVTAIGNNYTGTVTKSFTIK